MNETCPAEKLHAHSPYDKGYEAARAYAKGRSFIQPANPYEKDTPNHAEWLRGWSFFFQRKPRL